MGTLQTELQHPKAAAPQSSHKKNATATTPPPRTPAEFQAAIAARLEKLDRRVTTQADETTIEAIVGLKITEEDILSQIDRFDDTIRHSRKDSVDWQDASRHVAEYTPVLQDLQAQLRQYKVEYSSAYDDAERRFNTRRADIEHAETIRALDPVGTTADVFESEIKTAVELGYVGPGDLFSWGGQSYGPANPNSTATADAMADFVNQRQEARNDRNAGIKADLLLAGHFISAFRQEVKDEKTDKTRKEDSELDRFRKETDGVARKASEFLNGQGRYYVVRAKREFVVLERRDSTTIIADKTSGPMSGNVLFYRWDRTNPENPKRVLKDKPSFFEVNPEDPSDLSGFWYDDVRLGLEEDLRRETESDKRRETASDLRDISELEDPRTFDEIEAGQTGTVPVSFLYEDPETHRKSTVTFHVEGMGTHFEVTETVPGTETVIKRIKKDRMTKKIVSSKPFLPDFIGRKTPLKILNEDPVWGIIRDKNRQFECDWTVELEAKRRKAVLVSDKESLDGLTSIENGKDGSYAFRATLKKEVDGKKFYNPVGYVFDRNGSKIKPVWAMPGTSANYGQGFLGKEFEIADLPDQLRKPLDNLYWTITRTDAPAHLRRRPKPTQQDKRQQAEE